MTPDVRGKKPSSPRKILPGVVFATLVITIADSMRLIDAAATNLTAPARCYDRSRDYYPYFSTRTAYEVVHGHDVQQMNSTCAAAQVWMLARHGTRIPDEEVISSMLNMTTFRNQILRNHEQGASQLCADDLAKLRVWQPDPNISPKNAHLLVEQGERELRELAVRLRGAFPELLDRSFARPGDFVFRSTNTQRTEASMRAFYRGLFGNDESVAQPVPPPVNDTLLLAHKFCPAWASTYQYVMVEREKFTAGPEFHAVRRSVARRLGFADDLDYDTLRSMYDMCRFETSWQPNRTSTWCSLFRGDELKVLEYREDLDFYYFSGPGRAMSAMVGCPILSDMLGHFRSLASGNFTNRPKGVFYFGHTVALHTLMAALGINDEQKPPLASNYDEMQDRRYRSSMIGPFAANAVAVFYRCSQSKKPYRVALYTAERLVKMSGCQDGFCDWDFLERKYAQHFKCSMDFCHEMLPAGATSIYSSSKLIAMTLIVGLSRMFFRMTME